jgi:peptide/nickel transport system permease protein
MRIARLGLKVVSAVGVLLAAATVTFLVQVLMPGDRATLILNLNSGQTIQRSDAEVASINETWGFDDPVVVQYLHYMGGLLRGDLGPSYQQHQPVTSVIGEQVLPTLALTLGALVVAWVLSVGFILLTGRRSRVVSSIGSGLESLSAALPHYWLGVILLVVFAVQLQWFPAIGGTGLRGLVLPVVTLAVPLAGFLGQVTRDEFAKTLDQPFVTTARMRGMSDLGVRTRHALRHSVLPAITLFSGAVIAETVFTRPGLGQVLVTAVNARDLPVVAGVVMVVALVYVVANLLVDLAYRVVDPRLREVPA